MFSVTITELVLALIGVCGHVKSFIINTSPIGYYDSNTISGCTTWATIQVGMF